MKNTNMSNYQKASLVAGYDELKLLATEYDANKQTQQTANQIYKEALENDVQSGRSINEIALASIRMASIQNNNPIAINNLKEWDEDIDANMIVRVQKQIENKIGKNLPPVSIEDTLATQIKKFDLNYEYASTAYDLLGAYNPSGVSPVGLAASAIYATQFVIDNSERYTQREVAKTVGTTTVTIRNSYKDMLNAYVEHD